MVLDRVGGEWMKLLQCFAYSHASTPVETGTGWIDEGHR